MRKKDYNSIPFKNKAIDKLSPGKTKSIGKTEQGGHTVGVEVKRGNKERSKLISLEPSGDTSYSRSVKKPKSSRTKSVNIVDGKATKTITRTRKGKTTTNTKNLGEKKSKRLSKKYTRKVNRVFTDEGPAPTQGGGMIYKYGE